MLTTVEITQARHYTYRLISRLYLEGLTAELFPYVQALPVLAAATPPLPLNFEEAAATHYHLFGLNLFPYESVFLNPAGKLGGPITAAVAQRYRAHGYQVRADVAPDHIGHQCRLLAHLCAAEVKARETGQHSLAQQAAQHQHTFLAQHLVRWLPPFLVASTRQSDPFYRALATLTGEIVGDHSGGAPSTWTLPPSPDLLTDESIGLRQIASALLAPPLSGFFLSRDAISTLGRRRNLPRGFGNREQMLRNLLHSAAQYEQIPPLFTALRLEADNWSQAYADQARTIPTLAPVAAIWKDRVDATSTLLTELAEKANTISTNKT